jgi:acyl carrier protein
MSKKVILIDFIEQEFMRGRGASLKADDELLSSGIIDSLGILRLVAFVEERFGVQMPDEDVVFENFHSVNAIADYLETR